MTTSFKRSGIRRFRILMDATGQDLTDYALMAGFLIVVAGAISPMVANSIAQMFAKLGGVFSTFQGSSAK